MIDQEALSQMHNLGLLNHNAVIEDSGFATGKSFTLLLFIFIHNSSIS
jgi:hypothetical protein